MSSVLTLGRATALFTVIGLAACGGGSGDDTAGDDVQLQPDASGGGDQPDAEPAAGCAVAATISELGALASGVVVADTGYLSVGQALSADMPPDIFVVELYEGFEPFGTEAAPTPFLAETYQITGVQTDYATCGTCVTILGDLGADNVPAQVFVAQSGVLDLSSVEANFVGSLAPAAGQTTIEFKGFDVQGMDLVDNGCTATLSGTQTWDKPIDPPA